MNYCNYKYIHLLFIARITPNEINEPVSNAKQAKTATIRAGAIFFLFGLVLADQRVRRQIMAE